MRNYAPSKYQLKLVFAKSEHKRYMYNHFVIAKEFCLFVQTIQK